MAAPQKKSVVPAPVKKKDSESGAALARLAQEEEEGRRVSHQKPAAAARVVADRGPIYASGVPRQGRQGDPRLLLEKKSPPRPQDAAPEAATDAADADHPTRM